MQKKAIIAMSGGVDSSVAAYLMVKDGYDCAGATLKLYDNPQCSYPGHRACCTPSDTEDARSVAARLGMLYYVFPMQEKFHQSVIDMFADTYLHGGTPNPCIDCNRFLKFSALLDKARELGCEYIASGHYARREQDPKTGRFLLRKGLDPTKDQSYVLYAMTQDQLAHTLFPLGTYTKKEIREIAQEQGFINADKPDSQDICFVPDGDYATFIEQYTGQPSEPGDFVDKEGKVLGRHNYCYINDINLIPWDHLDKPIQCKVKTRYRQPEQPATVEQLGEDLIRITFQEPQRAVTPGQAAVLYDGDMVLGGGTILSEEAAQTLCKINEK